MCRPVFHEHGLFFRGVDASTVSIPSFGPSKKDADGSIGQEGAIEETPFRWGVNCRGWLCRRLRIGSGARRSGRCSSVHIDGLEGSASEGAGPGICGVGLCVSVRG